MALEILKGIVSLGYYFKVPHKIFQDIFFLFLFLIFFFGRLTEYISEW